MKRIAWPGLMQLGLVQLRLPPEVFWDLTPAELMLMAGLGRRAAGADARGARGARGALSRQAPRRAGRTGVTHGGIRRRPRRAGGAVRGPRGHARRARGRDRRLPARAGGRAGQHEGDRARGVGHVELGLVVAPAGVRGGDLRRQAAVGRAGRDRAEHLGLGAEPGAGAGAGRDRLGGGQGGAVDPRAGCCPSPRARRSAPGGSRPSRGAASWTGRRSSRCGAASG